MSAERRELRPRRERQDQFTRQQRRERAVAEQTGVSREAVETRQIGGRRPNVKEQAVRRSVAQEAGEDFSPADVRIIERDGQTIGGSVKDSAKRREVVQDVLGQVGEDFSAEDVAVRKTDTGSFEVEIKTAAAKREAAESVLENAPEGFTREDVAFSRSDDGIQARISESAIERKRQQQRQEIRKRTAGQSAVLDSEDITISETDDGLRAEPKEGALRESLREKFASNVDGVDPSDVTVSREDGQLVAKPTEQTRRRLIKEQVAEQRSFVDRDEVTVDLSGEDPDVTIRGGDRPKSVPEGADPGQDVDLPAGVPGDVVGSRQAAFAQFDTSLPAGLDKQDIREGDISAQRLVGIAGNLGTIRRQDNPAIGFRGKTKVRPADVGERQSDLPSATELANESDLSPAEVREAGELFRVKTAGGGIEAAGRTREAALRELGERAFEQSVDKLGSAAFTNEKLATVGIDREAAIKRQTRQRVLEQVPEDVKAGDIDVDIQNGQPTARVTSAAREDIRQAQRQSVKQQVAQRAGEGITTADVDVQRDDGQVTGRVEVSALRRETAEAAGERFKLRDVTVQSGAQGTLAFIGGAAVEREQAEIRRQAAQELSQDFGRRNVKEFDRQDIQRTEEGFTVAESARREAVAQQTIRQTAAQSEDLSQTDFSREDVTFTEQDGETVATVQERRVREELPGVDVRRAGNRSRLKSTSGKRQTRRRGLNIDAAPIKRKVDTSDPLGVGQATRALESAAETQRQGEGLLPNREQAGEFAAEAVKPVGRALRASSPLALATTGEGIERQSEEPTQLQTASRGAARRAALNPASVAVGAGKLTKATGEFGFNVGTFKTKRAGRQAGAAGQAVGQLAGETVKSFQKRPVETTGAAVGEAALLGASAVSSPVRVSKTSVAVDELSTIGKAKRAVKSRTPGVSTADAPRKTVRGVRLRTPIAAEKAGIKPRSTRTIVGQSGAKASLGAPSVDLSNVAFRRSAERTVSIEAGAKLERETLETSIKSQLGQEQAERFVAARELTGVGERVGKGGAAVETPEELARNVRAVPAQKAEEVGGLLREFDATVKGSASVRAQIPDARQPRDIDVVVQEPEAFKQRASQVLEGESADPGDIFDFADAGYFPSRGDRLKFGRRVPRRREIEGGVTLTSPGEELTRKAGASAFVRGRGTAGTADVDVGPEPRRAGRTDVRGKDPADAVTIGRALTSPGSRGRRRVERFAQRFDQDIGAAADTDVEIPAGAGAVGRGRLPVTTPTEDAPSLVGRIATGQADRGQLSLTGPRRSPDLDVTDAGGSTARRADLDADTDTSAKLGRDVDADSSPTTTTGRKPSPVPIAGGAGSPAQTSTSPAERSSPTATSPTAANTGASSPTTNIGESADSPIQTEPVDSNVVPAGSPANQTESGTVPAYTPTPGPSPTTSTVPGDVPTPGLSPTPDPVPEPSPGPGPSPSPGPDPSTTPNPGPSPDPQPDPDPNRIPNRNRRGNNVETEESELAVRSGFTKQIGFGVADEKTVLSGDIGDLGTLESFDAVSEEAVSNSGPVVESSENLDVDDLQ